LSDLRVRFGRLLAAHRKRAGLTQAQLAERAGLSVDMITKLETGSSGARFPAIEQLSTALSIDPAELFTTEVRSGARGRAELTSLMAKLATLSDSDLAWVTSLIDAALKRRG
jgi:transcriptional regulator with XRE-family HTH domain